MNIYDLIKKIVEKPKDRPFLIGIDGISGSGKTTTSKNIVKTLEQLGYCVHRISFDNFWSSTDDCRAKKFNPEKPIVGGDYRWQKLRDEILMPLREKKPVNCIVNDEAVVVDNYCVVDVVSYDNSLADNDVIIVEGVFVVRDELRKYFDYSIFIKLPRKTSFDRVLEREGDDMKQWYQDYWHHEENLYMKRQEPYTKVDWLIDEFKNNELPRRKGFISRLLKGMK